MAQIHWNNTAGGLFSDAADWTGGNVPGASDDAILDAAGGAFTVTSNVSETVNSIQLASNATLDITGGTFTASTGTGSGGNAGTIIVGDNTTFSVDGVLNNTGAINISSLGNDGTALLVGATGASLTGGGHVTLSDENGSIIEGAAAGDTLTNVNNTISGSGHLGNGQMTLINQSKGVIDATGSATALNLDTAGETVTNAGLIEATGSAGLGIVSTTVNDSTGGTISAGAGSHVSLQSADIIGGTLATSGTGVIEAVDRGSVLDGTTSSVANTGVVDINDNQALNIQGVINNTGTININSLGNNGTFLRAGAAGVTLTGGGHVTLSDENGNAVYGLAAADILTNVNNTISGSGHLGDGQMTLVNQSKGVIDATGTGMALLLDTAGETVTNAGLVEATGSAGLGIVSTTVNDSTGGTILAATGSHVSLQSADIIGGTLNTSGTGVIEAVDRGSVLDGTTSTVSNAGVLNINDNEGLTVQGIIANTKTGSINLNSLGNDGTLLIVGAAGATLTGGVVSMSDHGGNQIYGALSGPSGSRAVSTLTNKTTIAGSGNIGEVQMSLVNSGTVDATGATALFIETGGGNIAGSNTVSNTGLLEATNPSALTGTGGLILDNITVSNTTKGVIEANGATTQVVLASATISGGTLETANGGVIQTSNGNRSSALDGTKFTVNNTGAVDLDDNSSLTIQGAINNTGSINVNSSGNDGTLLEIGAAGASLIGSGQVTLTDHGGNEIFGVAGTDVLTNVNNTISGSGSLGDGQLTLSNQSAGVIDATGTATSLTLNTSGETVTNAGLIEATGSAGLGIVSTAVNDSTGGTITAATGSHVSLQSADIIGGTLSTSGTGILQTVDRGTVFDGATSGTLLSSGTVNINDNTTLNILGTIDNTGSINVNSGGNDATYLRIGATGVVLTGGGQVTLTDHGGNAIYAVAAADTLTNVNNTISGSGSLGDGQLTLTNQSAGVIDATGTNAAMTLNTSGETVTNAGLVEATGSAGLGIVNTTVNDSTGGTITAATGSHVSLQSADIIGGTLNTSGTGIFETVDRGTVFDGATSGTLLSSGTVNINDNTTLNILGTIDNTGSINVNSSGNDATYLRMGATGVVLTGGGQVTLTDEAGNAIYGVAAADTLTNVNNTISGSGRIGFGQLTLINQSKGVIDANGTNASMTLNTSGETVTNAGLIEATGSAGMLIQSTSVNSSTGGTISAGTGSHITLQSADLIGGTLSGTGVFQTNDRGTVLDGASSGTLNNASTVNISDNTSLTIEGTINNTGSINVASGGNDATQLILSGANVTLDGGGSVTVNGNAGNQILGSTATTTLTNAGNTLSGSGHLFDGNVTLINQAGGKVDGSGTAALILSTPGNTITNDGTLEGTGTGGLTISGAVVTGTGGTIYAAAGSNVTMQSSTVSGGVLSTAAGGAINIDNGSSFTGSGVFTDAGTITLGSTGTKTSLLLSGNTTLTGGGTITLSANKNNIIQGTKSTVVLTNDDTISGSGKIGAPGTMSLVNGTTGVIDADGKAALTINTGAKVVVNAGLIETTNAGHAIITGPIDNTGTLETNEGVLTLKGAVTGAGTAVINVGTLNAQSSFTENVDFAGNGKLILAQSQSYDGTITGFSRSSKTSLDLRDVGFVSATEATFSGNTKGGVLTVVDTTTGATAHITLVGDYTHSTFTSKNDGHGGASVTAHPSAGAQPPAAPTLTAAAPVHQFVAAMASHGALSAGGAHMAAEVSRTPLAMITGPRPHAA